MNVIIASDKSFRLTQQQKTAYNIQDISFYISKSLSFAEAYIKLVVNRNEYPFSIAEKGETANYCIYKVIFTQPVSLSARVYDFIMVLDEEEIVIGSHSLEPISVSGTAHRSVTFKALEPTGEEKPYYGLVDTDEPVDIIERTISFGNKQNILVGEDNISQLITFRMPAEYEGIEMYNKTFYVDYLNPDTKELFSLEIMNKDVIDDYLYLYWPVPYEITRFNKDVQIAITATEAGVTFDALDGHNNVNSTAQQYIWQTLPATLIVRKNLAKRKAVPESDGTKVTSQYVVEQVVALTEWQEEFEKSDISDLDSGAPYDGEILISGGGAAGGAELG